MFNEIITRNFTEPTFATELEGATHTLELGNPVCGDRIKVQLVIQDERVEAARYQAWGCATSLAAGNVFCSHLDGKPLGELLPAQPQVIETMLGELEPSQHHCLEMLRSLFDQLDKSVRAGR
jgi:nitrogen fixation NifU-like protein